MVRDAFRWQWQTLIQTDGHYLNLPVMNETGEIVGMVDVLKLTYATLEQINTMGAGESEGPAWNKFWLSMDNDSESMMSGEGSHRPATPGHRSAMELDHVRSGVERGDNVMPHESASHHGDDSHSDVLATPVEVPEDTPFPFKFKAPSGRVHRLQVVASAGMAELIANVTAKLGGEVEALGGEAIVEEGKLGKSGYALSYMDNEGDTVSITTDQDLVDAIALARKGHRDKVDLFVHNPSQPPISATLDPRPNLAKPPTPPESFVKEVHVDIQESEEEASVKRSRDRKQALAPSKEEQLVTGVPNDLLLPGAIAALAVVIVAVFAFSRTSNR
jgi:PB1 domain